MTSSEKALELRRELELMLKGSMPVGDMAYVAAEIAFVLSRMNGQFISRESDFTDFLNRLECSIELRADLMRDLLPLWGKISRLQGRYSKEECEATIRECASQADLDNVNVPPSLAPLVTKLLSSEPGGIMADIACGRGLVLARALEEDLDLHGEGIDINRRNANFSEMVVSPLKPRGDIYCKSAFDFMVDHMWKYDKVFCFPPTGMRMDRNWEEFQAMLPGAFPNVGAGCRSELIFALAELLISELARLQAQGRTARLQALVKKSLLAVSGYAAVVFALLYGFGDALGRALFDSAAVGRELRLFAPLVLFLYVDAIVDGLQKGLGQQLFLVRYNSFTNVIDVAGLWTTVPRFGLWGYLGTYCVSHLANLFLSLRRLLIVTAEPVRKPASEAGPSDRSRRPERGQLRQPEAAFGFRIRRRCR